MTSRLRSTSLLFLFIMLTLAPLPAQAQPTVPALAPTAPAAVPAQTPPVAVTPTLTSSAPAIDIATFTAPPSLTVAPSLTVTPSLTTTIAPPSAPPARPTLDAAAAVTSTPDLAPGDEGFTLTITPLVTPTLVPVATLPPVLAAGLSVTATAEERSTFALDQQVETLLAGMSVADKVGQLFVVTFAGNDTSFESAIAELIYAYRVGGVVLTPENGNFTNEPGADTPRQVAILANRLQAIAYGILLPTDVALQPVPLEPWPPSNFVSLERELGVTPPDLPLLVGVYQMGNALPGTSLRRGFTPLPSELALGSSWNLETAQGVGAIVGRELKAVGANLLLGPNLDVVEQPRSDAVGGLSVFSFGGNSSWVGQMGRAYISGVHTGSGNGVATVAGNFPGQGDLDRLPEEEVATIQRNREDIMAVAVPPFVAVTQPMGAVTDTALSDVLMTSHMRFNALQAPAGRSVPISLDPELPQFTESTLGEWRARGGLLMTGPLGVPAIRRFYDPALQDFPARRVALDAFTAGHDLLFLSRFALDESWESQLDNVRATIAFFQERYRSDADFAARVDESVRRILRLKLRLYGAGSSDASGAPPGALPIPLSDVLVQESDLAVLPGYGAPVDPAPAQAARDSITILSPDPATSVLPPAPQAGEQIVIVTDSRLLRECSTCTAEAAVDPDAISRIILSLYGPDATGQISPDQISSITFSDLNQILPPSTDIAVEGTPSAAATSTPALVLPTPTPTPESAGADLNESAEPGTTAGARDDIAQTLAQADWVIFAMLDMSPNYPDSSVVRRYLRQPVDARENQRIVVMALNAPYFLDATEISKLSLYYGVYSKIEPFLESAVRALFRTTVPEGAPAINAPGTRYASLADRLAPNPAVTIPLRLSVGGAPLASNTSSAAGTAVEENGIGLAVVNVGEVIHLEAGSVLDLNGHPVPDGVVVSFDANFEGAELALTIEPALTRNGIATRDLTLDRGGVLRVTAHAGGANSGAPVVVNVLEPQTTPTALPQTVVITVTPPLSALVAPTATVETAPAVGVGALPARGEGRTTRVNVLTLLLSLLTMLITLSLLLLAQIRVLPRETLFKSLIWAVIVGLAAYLLYAVGWLPGSAMIAQTLNIFGAPLIVFLAMLLPLFWLQLRSGQVR